VNPCANTPSLQAPRQMNAIDARSDVKKNARKFTAYVKGLVGRNPIAVTKSRKLAAHHCMRGSNPQASSVRNRRDWLVAMIWWA